MSLKVGKNALINIVGVVLPSLVGIVALRFLLDSLGQSAMGVFTLALGLVGISGILDFGLSRGITRYVAHACASAIEWRHVSAVLARCIALLCAIGVVVGGLIWLAVPHLTQWLRCEDASLCEETVGGFRWIGLSIPFALMSSGILSMLEGRQEFVRVNLVKVPIGFLVFIVPALVAGCTHSLSWTLSALAGVRVLGFLLCLAMAPFTFRDFSLAGKEGELRRLLAFSGWLSVSNVISPFLVYGDRFYLAAVIPAGTMALYTVPFDAAYRGTALPLAGLNAVFPALTQAGALGAGRAQLFARAREMLFLFWLCPLAIGCLLGKEILTLWLGASFAVQGSRLFQVVIGGVCLNGLAHLAVAMLHADGRSDLTAKFHVGELLPYGILVVLLVERYGVLGAAIAWSLRVMADFLLLCLAVGIRRIVGWDDLAKLVVPSVSMVAVVLIIGGVDSWMARLAISIVVALVGLLMLARMFALSRSMGKGS